MESVEVNGMSQVKTMSAGEDFSLAVKNNGTVWAWGQNSSQQWGDGTKEERVTLG